MAKDQTKPTPLPKEPKVDHTALLTEEVATLTEALQRERADAMNMRRRYEEQIMNLKSNLKADVVSNLLPVIDNFERAL